MADIENVSHLAQSRLGICEVCSIQPAKYTCPECEVKTCSLPCVKIHKKELECSGIRNKVKFKPLKKINNMDFQSDYILLEESTRRTDILKKQGKIIKNMTFYNLPRMKIKNATYKRNIHLYYLPKNFSRHKSNTTYYDWKKDKIFWKVEWVFVEADMTSLFDNRVPETEILAGALSKYLDPEKCDPSSKKLLSCYHNIDQNTIEVLLKSEDASQKKYYLLQKDDSIIENLSNKKIIENPAFYVIFSSSLSKFQVEKSGDSSKHSFSNNYKGINLLFDY